MSPVGCSATPGRLLDEDPVQSAVHVFDLRHVQLMSGQEKWPGRGKVKCGNPLRQDMTYRNR